MSTIALPFLQKPFIPTALRDSILTLLDPRPHVKTILGSGRSGVVLDIEIQRRALIAYRAKIVALTHILETVVKPPGNEPITRTDRKLPSVRKCMTSAGTVKAAGKVA